MGKDVSLLCTYISVTPWGHVHWFVDICEYILVNTATGDDL